MQTIDEKIDAAVHAAMTAMGLSAERCPDTADMLNDHLRDVCAEMLTDDDEDEAADPEQPQTYLIEVGREAIHYHRARTTGTVEQIKGHFTRHTYKGPIVDGGWSDEGVDGLGIVEEVCIIDLETNEIVAHYTKLNGWKNGEPD